MARPRSSGSVSLTGINPSDLPIESLRDRVDQMRDTPPPRARYSLRRSKYQNWAQSFHCRPQAIIKPRSEQDLRFVLALARREKRPIRLAGVGHSPSDLGLVDDRGWIVNVDALSGLFEVDLVNLTVTVGAGIYLTTLNELLLTFATPLALPTLGSISYQTLAGAISTSTHGSGANVPTLSSYVHSLTLILPDSSSSVVTVGRVDKEGWKRDLFRASLCGLGCTGALVRVKIQCEKAYALEERAEVWKVHDVIERLGEIREASEISRIYWVPHVGKATVKTANRTYKPVQPPPSLLARIQIYLVSHVIHQIGLFICYFFPSLLSLHAHLMWYIMLSPSPSIHIRLPTFLSSLFPLATPSKPSSTSSDAVVNLIPGPSSAALSITAPLSICPHVRIYPSPQIYNWDCLFRQYTYEGRVPVNQAQSCFRTMRVWLESAARERNGDRFHFPIEIRFVSQDTEGNVGLLSPNWDGPGVYFGVMIYKPYGRPFPHLDFFRKFESVLNAHGGRSHWAKEHTDTPESLGRKYEGFDKFVEVAKKVDPDGVLRNDYVKRHLGLELVGEGIKT